MIETHDRVDAARSDRANASGLAFFEIALSHASRGRLSDIPRGVAVRAWLLKHVEQLGAEPIDHFHGDTPGAAQTVRPYSLAVLPPRHSVCGLPQAEARSGTFILRIASLTPIAEDVVSQVWSRLDGNRDFGRIERDRYLIHGLGQSNSQGGSVAANALDLLSIADCLPLTPSGILLRFLTPTAFKITNQDLSFVPTTATLFEGLARRLAALTTVTLPEAPDALASRIARAFAQTRTDVGVFPDPRHNAERGFVGECFFELRRLSVLDREAIRWALALTQFAQFSGVGMETTRGMGCVSVELIA